MEVNISEGLPHTQETPCRDSYQIPFLGIARIRLFLALI